MSISGPLQASGRLMMSYAVILVQSLKTYVTEITFLTSDRFYTQICDQDHVIIRV